MTNFAYNYSASGVIAINTELLNIDCGKEIHGLSIQISSIGTTGVITPEWSNDGSTWFAATTYSLANAATTTINAAGIFNTNIKAKFLRLRLSTATTVGNTAISVFCLRSTTV